jgi:hypothetical protein
MYTCDALWASSSIRCETCMQVHMHVKVGFNIRLRKPQRWSTLQALISPPHTAQAVRHVKTLHCRHDKIMRSCSDSPLWMHANRVRAHDKTLRQSRPSLVIPKCKQLLTSSIPQPHTAHADQRHARKRSGVCCLMQSSMHESTCTRGMPCGRHHQSGVKRACKYSGLRHTSMQAPAVVDPTGADFPAAHCTDSQTRQECTTKSLQLLGQPALACQNTQMLTTRHLGNQGPAHSSIHTPHICTSLPV